MKRLLALLILVPVGIIIITMALANRQWVDLSLPPELGYAPLPVPLFALLFATLLLGMFLGGLITWLKQGKHRKLARANKMEANKMSVEAEKQKTRAEGMADEISGEMSSEAKAFSALGLPAPSSKAA